MSQEEVNLKKWKEVAEEVMGPEFFSNFFGGYGEPRSGVSQSGGPRYNVYHNSSEIIVLIELPYVQDVSQIELNVEDKQLIVKGEVKLGFEHFEKAAVNIFSGAFEKKIPLPKEVNSKKVNAQYKLGLLIVQLFPRRISGKENIGVNIQS